MSTSTGVAPASLTARAVAMKVLAGSNTLSPGPIPRACIAIQRASVPLATLTQCLLPTNPAKSRSNSATAGPRMKSHRSRTPATAASTSGLIERYWAFRSTRGIFKGGLPACEIPTDRADAGSSVGRAPGDGIPSGPE